MWLMSLPPWPADHSRLHFSGEPTQFAAALSGWDGQLIQEALCQQSGKKVKMPEDIVMDFEDEQALIDEIFPDLAIGGDCLNSAILMPLALETSILIAWNLNPFDFLLLLMVV